MQLLREMHFSDFQPLHDEPLIRENLVLASPRFGGDADEDTVADAHTNFGRDVADSVADPFQEAADLFESIVLEADAGPAPDGSGFVNLGSSQSAEETAKRLDRGPALAEIRTGLTNLGEVVQHGRAYGEFLVQ